jgi:hypothetical protein
MEAIVHIRGAQLMIPGSDILRNPDAHTDAELRAAIEGVTSSLTVRTGALDRGTLKVADQQFNVTGISWDTVSLSHVSVVSPTDADPSTSTHSNQIVPTLNNDTVPGIEFKRGYGLLVDEYAIADQVPADRPIPTVLLDGSREEGLRPTHISIGVDPYVAVHPYDTFDMIPVDDEEGREVLAAPLRGAGYPVGEDLELGVVVPIKASKVQLPGLTDADALDVRCYGEVNRAPFGRAATTLGLELTEEGRLPDSLSREHLEATAKTVGALVSALETGHSNTFIDPEMGPLPITVLWDRERATAIQASAGMLGSLRAVLPWHRS